MTAQTSGSLKAAQPLRIAIVGGGIGGLALLLGILHHANSKLVVAHLFESAAAFSEIGAGVGFGPNSVSAMKVIDPRLWESYDRAAATSEMVLIDGEEKIQWHEFHMGMDGRGNNHLKAGDLIGAVYNQNKKKNIHRATFLDEMIKLLPGGTGDGFVSFKKRCTEIDDLEEGGVRIRFADGSQECFDAVVGCDGVKSRVRKILLGDGKDVEPRFTKTYAYRGLVPMEDAEHALGPLAQKSHMFWGYGGHLVDFPIDKGKTLNIVAFQTKKNGEWEHGSEWVVPGTTADALEDFKDWSKPVRDLLSNLKSPNVWALFEHPPASTYHKGGKMCLLGDCAHASTPHQGAGAGFACEDAAVLSTLLGEVKVADPKVLDRVFKAYDAIRRPRSQKLVTTSRDAGLLYDFQKEGVLDDPTLLRNNIVQRMRWIWELDIDKHCAEAIQLMHQ